MGALGWILSIVGVLGVGGAIALAIFAPVLAAALAKIALDILQRILATRIGCAVLAAIAAGLVCLFYGDHQGASRVHEEWDEAKVEYAEAKEALRVTAKTEATRQVGAAVLAERAQVQAAEQRIADYEKRLAEAPAGACALDDADLAAAGVQPDRKVSPDRLGIGHGP